MVMTSLRDDETYRVGICGMGGVGKTTMAKKIMDLTREEHLFEEISMVVVNQTADPLKIQKSLAESLGLKLEDESLPARAHHLRTRLSESKKKALIVVDDVWENLSLEEIGIPCNSQCKVLLTSRNRDVLRRMNVDKLHVVQVLSKAEAWDLFKLYVGSCIEHENLKSIAQEVIAECKGLPVALVTVGVALKSEENAGIWKDWLHQLKSNNPIGLPDILDDVYKPLRLSYEFLKNEEAKSLLEELIMEGSFDEWQAENFEKGKKNAFLSELEKLSSLRLLKIEIKDSSLVNQQTSLSPNMVRFHIRIGESETRKFYASTIYEKIMELVLPANISMGKGFVKCLESVEELYLKGDGSSLDFGVAKEIKVLVIRECSLKKLVTRKIAHIAFPRLEVLELQHLSELKEICDMDRPMPSTFLRNLRELRLEDLPALEHLNVASNFNKLSVIRVRRCNRLKNLFSVTSHSSLAQLKSLKIEGCDMMEQVFLWNNEENQFPLVFADLKSLKLQDLPNLTSFSEGNGSIEFPVLEELEVRRCRMKNFVSTISTKDDDAIHLFCKHDKIKFDCLRTLMFYRGNFEMEGIWCPQVPLNFFFPRLHKLQVSGLKGLKSLFSLSTTETDFLSQLEWLEIWCCDVLEEVILWNKEETNNRIARFPKLEFLLLSRLPRLTSFSRGIESIEFPMLEAIQFGECPMTTFVSMDSSTTCPNHDDDAIHLLCLLCKSDKVEFSSLKTLEIGGYYGRSKYWCPQLPMIDIFSGLSELKIFWINGIKSLFSCSVAQNLQNMTYLHIYKCDEMVGVIEDEDDACGGETPPFQLFPNLDRLDLRSLPKLKSFCEWRCALEFPLLAYLEISGCGVMEKFTSGTLNTPLLKCISRYPPLLITNDVNTTLRQRFLDRVHLWNGESNNRIAVFLKLRFLNLNNLPRLTSFSRGIGSIEFPALEAMEVKDCPMTTFVSNSSSTGSPNHDDDAIHQFCKDKVKLISSRKHQLQYPPQIPHKFFFPSLRKVQVHGLNRLKNLFSLSTTQSDCLSKLDTLEISNCDMLEEVILWNEEESNNCRLFPKLKFLKLNNLPRLTSFSRGTGSMEFPEKVEFSSLKKLEVGGYSGRSRYWCPQLPLIDIFSGLSELHIIHIDGIKSLFSCSVAQNLQNMTCLEIWLCKEMVRVIEDEDDACGGETPPSQFFLNLRKLDLYFLPKLKCFCEWRCALEFPSLTDLDITGCELMEKFTSGPLNTPLLKCIGRYQPLLNTNDLNTTLQQSFLNRLEKQKRQLQESSVEIKEEVGE